MADSEVLASASVEIHPYLSPSFSRELMAQMNGTGMSGAGKRAGDGFLSGMSSSLKGASSLMGSVGNALTSRITAPAVGAATAVAGIFAVKGWERLTAIDTAESKLKGLGYSAESIEGIMASALASVKGTAYGLGDAATAAVSALAAGVGEGDELTRVLTTIGDTATIAGGDFQGVASVFNKVMSKGKMQGDEMLQLSERGVPVLQTLAKYLGKTSEDITEMVKEGEIDFATFEGAMRDAFGGAALASGESMTGTIDNLWAAVGRVGAAFLDSGDDGEGFFGRLKPLLGEATEGIDGLCDIASDAGAVLADGLVEGVDAVKELAGEAKEMWDNLSPDQQGQLKAIAGIALAAGPALKVMAPLASGLSGVFGIMSSGVGAVRSFQGSMRTMGTAARNGQGSLRGLPAAIGGIAHGSKAASAMVSGLSRTLSFAAGAVPLLAAGFAAFEVVSFVAELGRAQTEAGKLEASFGELTRGHENMVDAFNNGAQLATSTDNLLGESGRTMQELEGVVDECEGNITDIIRTANEEKRGLREEEVASIADYNGQIAAAYSEQVGAHVALLQEEAKIAPELIKNMSAEEVSAYVGGIKQRGDEALQAESEAYERQRLQLATQHSQGVTDEQAYSDALLALGQDHEKKMAAIRTATADASGAAALAAQGNTTETLAAFARLTEGMGLYSPLIQSGFRDVVDESQQLQDKTRITADQFRTAWAEMSEGSIEGATSILEAAGQASQGMGELDERTQMAVQAILAGFDGLSGETAEVGKQALMELVDSLGDPTAVTGGIDTAAASCQEIVDAIRDNLNLEEASQEAMDAYVSVLETGGVRAEGASEEVSTQTTAPLYGMVGLADGIGLDFSSGLASGISSGSIQVATAAGSVAQAAVTAARAQLQINSPSRVMKKVGAGVPEGLALGIEKGTPAVARASRRMAASAERAGAVASPAYRPAAAAAEGDGTGAFGLSSEAIGYLRFIAENLCSAMSVSLDGRVVTKRIDERQGRTAALLARKGA